MAEPLTLTLRTPTGTEEERTFTGDVVRVGRAEDCELSLASGYISRYHARFQRSGEGWEVVDEGSKNGVFVNGHRISGSQELHSGDMVRIGDHTVVFAPDLQPEEEEEPRYDRTLILPPQEMEAPPAAPQPRLLLDGGQRTVTIEGQPPRAPLTAREYRLIDALAATGTAPHGYPRVTLVDLLWGPGGGDGDMLDRLADRIRAKIEPDPTAPQFLLDDAPATRTDAGDTLVGLAPGEPGYRLNCM
jgi:pSer/pThr/pTyr-binding forkhead associated (FHA) protein